MHIGNVVTRSELVTHSLLGHGVNRYRCDGDGPRTDVVFWIEVSHLFLHVRDLENIEDVISACFFFAPTHRPSDQC